MKNEFKAKDAAFCLFNGTMYRMQYTEEDYFVMRDECTEVDVEIYFDNPDFMNCRFFKLVEF